jgi:hypothetical protein
MVRLTFRVRVMVRMKVRVYVYVYVRVCYAHVERVLVDTHVPKLVALDSSSRRSSRSSRGSRALLLC